MRAIEPAISAISEAKQWEETINGSAKSPVNRWRGLIRFFISDAANGEPWRSAVADHWFERLTSLYNAPGRKYHTLDHVMAVLAWLPVLVFRFKDQKDFFAFQLAAWFHDSVYDSRQTDNEIRSAQLLRSAARDLRLDEVSVGRAERLILATTTHFSDESTAAFCDADLAILGSPVQVYDGYQKSIRAEYQWVEDSAYRPGRSRVLQKFLDRGRIFQTDEMCDRLELPARRNLTAEISSLA